MLNRSEKIRLVSRLHLMTLQGTLKWQFELTPEIGDEDERTSEVYKAEWNDIQFRLYRREVNNVSGSEPDWVRKSAKSGGFPRGFVRREWKDQYVLEMVDLKSRLVTDMISDFSVTSPVRDLFSAVREKHTDIDSRLRSLIQDSELISAPTAK
jgi:hypothetical protein